MGAKPLFSRNIGGEKTSYGDFWECWVICQTSIPEVVGLILGLSTYCLCRKQISSACVSRRGVASRFQMMSYYRLHTLTAGKTEASWKQSFQLLLICFVCLL